MGFFGYYETKKRNKRETKYSAELLGTQGCKVCPLRREEPKLDPTGTDKPLIYMLGEAPGANEAKEGVQFIGDSGQLLRSRIPDWAEDSLRWNNCIRSRPPNNDTPTAVELACCRPSIVEDIERTKPKAIFGFGNVPLTFALNRTGVMAWNGRRAPCKIGNHVCWYYGFLHPAYVLRSLKKYWTEDYSSEMEFFFAKALERAFDEIEDLPEADYHDEIRMKSDIRLLEKTKEVVDWLYDVPDDIVGIDYETNTLRPYGNNAEILSVAVSTDRETVAFGLDHRESGIDDRQRERILVALEDLLYRPKVRKVAHNLAFELEWSAFHFGTDVTRTRWGDTMAQAYVLDTRIGALSLDHLCLENFGVDLKATSNLDRLVLDKAPLSQVLEYNALDAKYARLLYQEQAVKLFDKGSDQVAVYGRHVKRVKGLVLTQMRGIPINPDKVKYFKEFYEGKKTEALNALNALPLVKKYNSQNMSKFRPNSSPDVKKLFKAKGIILKKADINALKEIKHPAVQLIMDWRKPEKILSTYIIKDSHIYPDGLLHPVFKTMATVTSRTSAESPNPQNQIKRSEHKVTRSQIEAREDWVIVSVDYASIQARNVAMESKDPALVQAFIDWYDIHSDWLERIVKAYPKFIAEGSKQLAHDKELFKTYRHKAKNEFVFPSFFGAQPYSLSGYLGIPEEVCEELQDEFWDRFKGVKTWHRRVKKNFIKTGYTTGLSGYRRHAPISWNEIINSPIQADEAVIVMDALYRLTNLDNRRMTPILEVHDDLTFHWPKKKLDEYLEQTVSEMLRVEYDWINVPIVVEASVGKNWHDLERIGDFESTGEDTWRQVKK